MGSSVGAHEDVLAGAEELDDADGELGVVGGVGGALGLEEVVERDGIGLGGEACAAALATFLGEGNDAIPARGDADDALQAGAAAVAEGAGHDAVGGDHEVFDEVHGAVLEDFAEIGNVAVGDDGVGFGALEL